MSPGKQRQILGVITKQVKKSKDLINASIYICRINQNNVFGIDTRAPLTFHCLLIGAHPNNVHGNQQMKKMYDKFKSKTTKKIKFFGSKNDRLYRGLQSKVV